MKATKLPSGNYRVQVVLGIDINGKRVVKSVTRSTKQQCLIDAQKIKECGFEKRLTVFECIEQYIQNSPFLSPTTIAGYEKILRFAFPSIMDVYLDELTKAKVQNAINLEAQRKNRNGKTISAKTVHNEYGLLRSALADKDIKFNVRLPKVYHKNEILPPPAQVINAIKGTDIELPCLLAMWMSLRLSEVMGICYEDIKGDLLCINRVRVRVNNKEVYKDYAKNDTSIRILKIPPYILQLINNTKANRLTANNGDFTPLFLFTGNALHHKFIKLMKKHNLDLTFHDLRHYYASISLTMLGLPSKIVQINGGWSNPATLNKIYSQGFESSMADAFVTLNDYFMEEIDKSNTCD